MEEELEQLAQCIGSVRLTKIPNDRSLETLIDCNNKIRLDLSCLKQPLSLGEHEYLEPYVTSAIIETDHFSDSEYLYNYKNVEHVEIVFSRSVKNFIDDRDISDFYLAICNLPKLKTLKLQLSQLVPEQASELKIGFRFPGSKIQVEFPETRRQKIMAKLAQQAS